jgi:hypothetical protein
MPARSERSCPNRFAPRIQYTSPGLNARREPDARSSLWRLQHPATAVTRQPAQLSAAIQVKPRPSYPRKGTQPQTLVSRLSEFVSRSTSAARSRTP